MSTRTVDRLFRSSGIAITPGLPICQTDLPLDWYQDDFKSYAQEYLALPDRTLNKAITISKQSMLLL